MPVQNYLRGAPMPGQDLPEIGNMLQRKYAVDAEQQRRNALLQLDQQEFQAGQQERADLEGARRAYSDWQAFQKNPQWRAAVAQGARQKHPEWANASDDELITRMGVELQATLGITPEAPKQKTLYSTEEGYLPADKAEGKMPYRAPQRAPAPRTSPSPKTETPKPAEAASTSRPVPGFDALPPDLKLTEVQSKYYLGASMLAENIPVVKKSLADGYEPTRKDLFAVGPPLKGMANSFMQEITPREKADPRAVSYFNSGSKILTAILRPESGGAITEEEWTMYGPMYLPWPGDSKEERERKVASLDAYMDRLAASSGPAAQYFTGQSEGRANIPPPAALKNLKEGKVTTFANGQKWTLRNGQAIQVQ